MSEPPAKRRKVLTDTDRVIRQEAEKLLKSTLPELGHFHKELLCEKPTLVLDAATHKLKPADDGSELITKMLTSPAWSKWAETSSHALHDSIKQRVLVMILEAFVRRGYNPNFNAKRGFYFHHACVRHHSMARAMLKLPHIQVDLVCVANPDTEFWGDIASRSVLDVALCYDTYGVDTLPLILELIQRSSERVRSGSIGSVPIHTPLLVLAYRIETAGTHFQKAFDLLLSKAELDGTGLDLRPTMAMVNKFATGDAVVSIMKRYAQVQAYCSAFPLTLHAALFDACLLPIRDLVALVASYILKP